MILAIALVAHLLMSLLILSMPHLTHRQILFGVVVPADFRSSPEGRRAIRIFRRAVAIPALAALITMIRSDAVAFIFLASLVTILAGGVAFVWLHRSLRPFAVEPKPIRVFELSVRAERLPWFTWLGLVPPVLLVAASLYLHAHWDKIPLRYPDHWDLERNPNGWADRSWRRCTLHYFSGSRWRFGSCARAGDMVRIAPIGTSPKTYDGLLCSHPMGRRSDDGRGRVGAIASLTVLDRDRWDADHSRKCYLLAHQIQGFECAFGSHTKRILERRG